jgi:uncharacterized protein YfaP (DUF2135 family)
MASLRGAPLLAALGMVLGTLVVTGSGGAVPNTGAVVAVPRPYAVNAWRPNTDNLIAAQGTITIDGIPVTGARVKVDGYVLPSPTDAQGRFVYLADGTRIARHVVSVVGASQARAAATPLTGSQASALLAKRAAITIAYPVRDLRVTRDAAGRPVVAGRIAHTAGAAPAAVSLYSYELTGTVTDANGRPVVGARVSTRTLGRDYWTLSVPTDAQGRYSSLFTASDASGDNPVPFTVRVAKGDLVYQFLSKEVVEFQLLRSAKLDLRLPPRGYPMLLPLPRSYPGAIYEGIVFGVARGDVPVRPVSVTWPDAGGRFRMVLPRSLAGGRLSLWEGKSHLFSHATARPGGAIDLRDWPAVLAPAVPRDLARVTLR